MRDFEFKEIVLTLLNRIAKSIERIAASYPPIPKKPKEEKQ